jgi:poly(beta-D-mannuronate) lyase
LWSGLALAAAGVALDDHGFFEWGVDRARAVIGSLNTDGTLPHELAAGKLALHDHLSVLQPLSVLNELAHANGIDLEADGRLSRMVAAVFAGARQKPLFAPLKGQQRMGRDAAESADPLIHGAGLLVWLRRHPDAVIYSALAPLLPLSEPGLGGNVGLLYGP